jgi:hypothetical protein
MQRVIVTVKRQNEARVRDVEVPADMPADQLARTIARALNWEINLGGALTQYQIEAYTASNTSRVLQPDETLANADVWDGAWLVLSPQGASRTMPRGQTPSAPSANAPASAASPVSGWRSLGIDLPRPPDQSSESNNQKPGSGFEWKQLD